MTPRTLTFSWLMMNHRKENISTNKKIVVLTGSFNPATRAHYKILSDAVESVHADKGLFVAANDAYLINKTIVKGKSRTPFLLNEETRKKMLESLNKENEKLFFWGFELGGESPSTYATLKRVMKDNKGYELYYLCGADKLHSLENWSHADEMFSSIRILVYARAGIDMKKIISESQFLAKYEDRIELLETSSDIEDVSSTDLRKRFFAGEDYHVLMNDGPYEIMKSFSPSDFKEPTPDEVIEDTIKYGGRFGENAARILVYKENVKIFKNWDSSRLGDRNKKIAGTKIYKEVFSVEGGEDFLTEFYCVNSDCADVAADLINAGMNPVILNPASNIHPGADYDKGGRGTEELLCQMSTLSQSLYRFGNPKLKYFKEADLKNVPGVYPLNIRYGGIYSPDVCFFRNNISQYYCLRDKTFECSIISVPQLCNKDNTESEYFDSNGSLNEKGIEIESDKIRTILRIAFDNEHDSIVLNQFGCDTYNLKPEDVSRLFANILNEFEFKNKFRKIVFAIYEGKGSSRRTVGREGKFKAFYNAFGKR